MSKKKGPFLITDLVSKIGGTPTSTRSTKTAENTDHARNAYGFIAENYKNTSCEPEEKPNVNQTVPEKTGSNQVQIGFKTGSNQVQKPVQNGFKSGSEKKPSKLQFPKSGSESGSTLVQNGFKTGSNQVQNDPSEPETSAILMARGDQRRVLDFLFDLSVNAGDRSTPSLSSAEIGNALQMPQESVRTALKRLIQRGAILRRGFQRGRSGWSAYELSQTAYRELLDFRKSGSNWVQIGFKSGSKSGSESGSTPSSSSSYVLEKDFKTTTTDEVKLFDDERIQLSPDWMAVDFTPLVDVGFSRAHLIQLAKHGKLAASEVQDSIHFFAFDLKRNGKGREIKGSPVNFFMGILRKGLPYAPPENYESPEQTARREYLEGKRRLEEQRQAEEKELEVLEFSEWRRGLTRTQIAQIVPEVVLDIPRACEESLKAHFHENIWPMRRAAIPTGVENERIEIRMQIDQALGDAT